MKRFYECTFIINPGMDDAQMENTVKSTEDTISKNGGEVASIDRIGRRRLAYPIGKKHNGFYICMEFEAEPHITEKLERYLTLDENVMRYLTLQLDKRQIEAKRNRAAFGMQTEKKPNDTSAVAEKTGPAATQPVKEPAKDEESK